MSRERQKPLPTYSFPATLGTSDKGEEVHGGFAEGLSLASARRVWNKAIIPLLGTVPAHPVGSGCTSGSVLTSSSQRFCTASLSSCSCPTLPWHLRAHTADQRALDLTPDPSVPHTRRRNTKYLQSQRQSNDKFCLCREFAWDYYHFKGQVTAPSAGSQGFE